MKGGLSVRSAEALVKAEGGVSAPKTKSTAGAEEKDADTKALEGDLSATLGMKVVLNHKPGQEQGHMTIRYKSLEELDELCRILSVQEA